MQHTSAVPRPVGPLTLTLALRCSPPLPTSLAGLLDGTSGAPAFRRLVEAIFPQEARAILTAERLGADRREARVAAFLERVEAQFFPVYALDDWYAGDEDPYNFVLRGIPFQRFGWGEEEYHDLDRRDGHRLLYALCQQPYDDAGAHLALLESLEPLVPLETLLRLPLGGLPRETLHARLDGGRFAAAAEFADWAWGLTGTAFLDFDDSVEIVDAHWTRAVIDDLAEQWRQAEAILTRIEALATWLEADPPAHFAALLDVALREPAGEANADVAGETGDGATDDVAPPAPGEPGDDDRMREHGGAHGDETTDPGHGGGTGDGGEQPLPARPAT